MKVYSIFNSLFTSLFTQVEFVFQNILEASFKYTSIEKEAPGNILQDNKVEGSSSKTGDSDKQNKEYLPVKVEKKQDF